MKKISVVVVILLLSISFLLPVNGAKAQVYEDGVIELSTQEQIPTLEDFSTESGKVNYELPFPGMLPDNPFYFLKMLRDKVVKTLISDPYKRAQFNLLTAQKRMFAGKLLIEKKKYSFAIATIEKSNNYLDDTLSDIKRSQREDPKNTDIKPFLEHFKTVVRKHIEVLKEIKPSIGKQNIERFERQEERPEEILKNVEILIKQK